MLIRILTAISCVTILFFSQNTMANDSFLVQGNFEEMRRADNGIVTEVITPLTLKLKDGRFIHLAGLDYPDLDYYDPGDLSVTALKILKDFLTDQPILVYQTPSSKQGRINRMGHNIAHVVRADEEIWVQGMLISLGIARTRTTLYNPEMASQMLALENKAREAKNGMWDMNDHKILTPEQAKDHIGAYKIVEGYINSASMHNNRLYLNFGNNWREDFTVSVSAFDLKRFTRQKIYPKDWNGKKIRVRGFITSYNGPYMEINHPQRFEALFETDNQTEQPNKRQRSTQNKTANKTESDITKSGTALPDYNR